MANGQPKQFSSYDLYALNVTIGATILCTLFSYVLCSCFNTPTNDISCMCAHRPPTCQPCVLTYKEAGGELVEARDGGGVAAGAGVKPLAPLKTLLRIRGLEGSHGEEQYKITGQTNVVACLCADVCVCVCVCWVSSHS